jgi:hypothetical protein
MSSSGIGPRIFLAILLILVMTPTGRILCHDDEGAYSMTDFDGKDIDLVEANKSRQSAPTGRDIVAALESSPLADVQFERFTIKSKVRDINL